MVPAHGARGSAICSDLPAGGPPVRLAKPCKWLISRPVLDVRFTDSVLRLLSATEALTATQRLGSDTNFYRRRFATGVVCPALRAQGFRVTGQTV